MKSHLNLINGQEIIPVTPGINNNGGGSVQPNFNPECMEGNLSSDPSSECQQMKTHMKHIFMDCYSKNPDYWIMGFTLLIIVAIRVVYKSRPGGSPTRWVMAIFGTIMTKEMVQEVYLTPEWCKENLDLDNSTQMTHEMIFGIFP